jgi:hexokinase
LWELKAEAEAELLSSLSQPQSDSEDSHGSPFAAETEAEIALSSAGGTTTVAFNGSVVERYPGYRERLQGFVDALLADAGRERTEGGSEAQGENGDGNVNETGVEDQKGKGGAIVLVEASESSLRGAAVALACLA